MKMHAEIAVDGKGEEHPLPNEGEGDTMQECPPGYALEAQPAI